MDKAWRAGSPTWKAESIVGPIERNRRAESGFRNRTEGNDRWGSRRWKTRSSSTRSKRFSTRFGKRTFWALAMACGLWVGIVRKRLNWVIDLDIRSFFDKLQSSNRQHDRPRWIGLFGPDRHH